jgi:hypothetical protein
MQQPKAFPGTFQSSMEYRTRHALQTWRIALWYSDKVTVQSIFWNISKLYGVPNQTCPADLEGCIMIFGQSNNPKHFLEHYKRAGIFNRKFPSRARSQRFAWFRKQQLYKFPVFFKTRKVARITRGSLHTSHIYRSLKIIMVSLLPTRCQPGTQRSCAPAVLLE